MRRRDFFLLPFAGLFARAGLYARTAAPQSAPPDTLSPARPKTVAEAIGLIEQAVGRNAAKLEPLRARSRPEEVTRERGTGFFTEGDSRTGEWKEQQGWFWTGSFWTGELWQLYARPSG